MIISLRGYPLAGGASTRGENGEQRGRRYAGRRRVSFTRVRNFDRPTIEIRESRSDSREGHLWWPPRPSSVRAPTIHLPEHGICISLRSIPSLLNGLYLFPVIANSGRGEPSCTWKRHALRARLRFLLIVCFDYCCLADCVRVES